MKQLIKEYALKFVGLPYLWGGDDPIKGFDCSGLVQEILEAAGIDPVGDQTAQGLYDYFVRLPDSSNIKTCGALAFYGKNVKEISHVALLVDDFTIIEAGGGGSRTQNLNDASNQNAFIRLRPVHKRKDLVAVVYPKYPSL